MTALLQTLINGAVVGSVYAIVAVGFVLLFKATQVLNFAHGFLLVLGSYLSVTFVVHYDLPYVVGLLALVAVGSVLGWATFHGVMRRTVGAPLFSSVMVTIGLGLMLESATAIAYGHTARSFRAPIPRGVLRLGDISIAYAEMIVIGSVIVLILLLTLLFQRTQLGLEMRAVASDLEAAASQGVNIVGVFAFAWAIAVALGLVGGLFVSTLTPLVNFGFAALGLRAFPAAVVGGLDSVPGAIVGGFLIGAIEAVGSYYWGSEVRDALVFGVLLLVIMIRPTGLFGSTALVRA